MDVKLFNGKSRRAHLARLAQGLSPWIKTFEATTVLLLVGGIALLIIENAIGWALIGLTAIPAMVVQWYEYGLRKIPPVKDGRSVDDLMESQILGLLPVQPTPKDIASVLNRADGGLFFSTRFGIGGGFLEQIVSNERQDARPIFEEALLIAETVGNRITAGVLILALVRQIPSRKTLLGHLQLEEDDLVRGINWYHRMRDMIDNSQTRSHRPGGIGRDWSFGWIPTLSRFGENISEYGVRKTDIHSEAINQIIRALDGNGGSVTLVGQNGVGKTEIMYELASQLMDPTIETPERLRYHQIFMLDANRLLAVASERGELEGLINALLGEAYAAKNIIICLDNAQVFFEDGVGAVDITNILMPVLEARSLPIILAMDEQRFLQISKRTPSLTNVITRINIHPTSESDTLKVLQYKIPLIEYRRSVTFMYQGLREAYKLGGRYIYDTAMPGQAISLLEAATEYAESGYVTAKSVGMAIEKTIGVKTNSVDDDSERETLLNMESLIHKRMIGQERAVTVVSDALRRARSGIRNQKRPVGTFLFLGPTGVGKTELAKSLAAVYFGGEDRMIRLDMNEFVSPDDVARLIADGADDPSSLTAQAMKQPFSVVLLDEIEKAHSSVLTTLLQLLDEGILRDTRNREVSFRDTIVIATSNAGSDRIQEYIHRGYDLEQFEETFLNELISSHVFHPEFLNRFDEMIIFAPLTKPQLLEVVDLILASVNKNLEEQNISVTVTDDAKEYLVEAGYDPRLGARPMRRVVQRAVENTVAKQMLAKQVEAGATIEITLEQVASMLDAHKKAQKMIDEAQPENSENK